MKSRIHSVLRLKATTRKSFLMVVAAVMATIVYSSIAISGIQAQGDLNVEITDVDYSQFPTISGRILITDSGRLAIPPDSLDEIAVAEDGKSVEGAQVSPIVSLDKPVFLVLIVDTGGQTEDSLIEISQVVDELLEQLTEHDQALLISFASSSTDNASPMVSKTNDFTLISNTVASLSSQDRTPLYSAAIAGINEVQDIPSGRKIIVVIGDGREVAGLESLDRDEVIDRARSESVRLNTIGIAPEGLLNDINLKQLSELTAGRYWVPGDTITTYADVLTSQLRTMKTDYEFQYESQIGSYGPHTLTISATSAGRTSNATLSISPISSLPSPSISITAGTVLRSVTAIKASIPNTFTVDRMRFLIDGKEIATADSSPYLFDLDPQTIPTGQHSLVVRGESSIHGNSESEVIFHIPELPRARIDISDGTLIEGTRNIVAALPSGSDVDIVRFLIDNQEIAVFSSPPYSIQINGGDYPPGIHVLEVQVEDVIHGESSTSARFYVIGLPPPIISPESGAFVDSPTQISAMAPTHHELQAVEFWVDGTLTSRSEIAPYSYTFNPIEHIPGPHIVEIMGIGQFKQQATTEIVMHVLPLPEPRLDVLDEIGDGESRAVTISIDSGYAVSSIDVLIDSRLVDTLTEAPFVFQIPISALDDGEHMLHVIARSGDDRDSVAMRPFLVSGQMFWVWVALGSTGAALVLISLGIFGLRVRGRRRHISRQGPDAVFEMSVYRAGDLLRTIPLIPGRLIIGRADESDIQLVDDVYVSRRHAVLHITEDTISIEDFRSTNPSLVDGQPIPPLTRIQVESGVSIAIGDFDLQIEKLGNETEEESDGTKENG